MFHALSVPQALSVPRALSGHRDLSGHVFIPSVQPEESPVEPIVHTNPAEDDTTVQPEEVSLEPSGPVEPEPVVAKKTRARARTSKPSKSS